jgi:hypothetical protein
MPSKTVCCIATGPSVTQQQVDAARLKGFRLFVCNNAYQLAPDADLLYAVNIEWWNHYWPEVKDLPCAKWTTSRQAADKFPINWMKERHGEGLCEQPDVIHHGHGSGFSLVSMAHKAGASRIVLLGYDMKYSADYDGQSRRVGSGPRHFFGEYPQSMQHWPSVHVKGGVHIEMCRLYRTVADQGLVEVINATPGSALDCFQRANIEDL